MTLRDKIEEIAVIRELFGLCFYCGRDVKETPLTELVKVDGRDRLAHAQCPEELPHVA